MIALGGSAASAETLAGRVTDVAGKPIANARIHVHRGTADAGKATTDKDGRYSVDVAGAGTYSVTIAADRVQTFRQVVVADNAPATLDVEMDDLSNGEVIRIVDTSLPRPAVMPKPASDSPQKSLPYSKQAIERDAWARAWVLLDIDETGHVTRLKLLKRPGFDLDQIAVDEAFKLKFEPARDGAGKPIRTYLVWNMEWPSMGWLVQGNGTGAGRPKDDDPMYPFGLLDTTTRVESVSAGGARGVSINPINNRPMPVKVEMPLSRVPCAGSGGLNLKLENRAYRDCSKPDLSKVATLPWITPDNAHAVLAELAANTPPPPKRVPRSHVPELITGSASLVFGAALVVSVVEYNKYSDAVSHAFGAGQAGSSTQPKEQYSKWQRRMFESAGAFVVTGAVTAFLWSRNQTREEFSVQPTTGGATLSWGRAF